MGAMTAIQQSLELSIAACLVAGERCVLPPATLALRHLAFLALSATNIELEEGERAALRK